MHKGSELPFNLSPTYRQVQPSWDRLCVGAGLTPGPL